MNNLMLRNYIKLCLHENLAGDSLGKAADLEEAIIAAAKEENPENFETLARSIVKMLGAKDGFSFPDPDAMKPSASKVSDFWKQHGGSDRTPKTDMIICGHKISLKMGSGQFMSGGEGESRATLMAALESAGESSAGMIAGALNDVVIAINKMQRSVEYSMDITALRKKDIYTDKQPSGEGFLLREQEKIQAELQANLLSLLDLGRNGKLKTHFVLEAMTGRFKFGDESDATAEWLLTTAGRETIYNSKNGISTLGPKKQTAALLGVADLKPINKKLAEQYASSASIQVKFKSRKSRGQRNMSDVVGIMITEAENFKRLVKSRIRTENKQIISDHRRLLKEGFYDTAKSAAVAASGAMSSAWEKIVAWAEELQNKIFKRLDDIYKDAVTAVTEAAALGWTQLIEFLGYDIVVDASI